MMKKLSLLCAMALVMAALCVPQVYATDITAADTIYSTSGPAYWQNQGETGETEPGTVDAHPWDLQTFQQTGTTISMTGGYNFAGGYDGTTGGDLFIAKNATALFGKTAPSTGLGTNGNQTIKNIYGYNYAVVANFGASTYAVYAIDSGTDVESVYYRVLDFSNPWKLTSVTGFTPVGVGSLTLGQSGTGDSLIYTLAYNGLLGQIEGFGKLDYATLHYTYSCGNDFMIGNPLGSEAPIPPSALLLGTGLLGLLGLGWRRRQQNV
jgi:hypothetical protein